MATPLLSQGLYKIEYQNGFVQYNHMILQSDHDKIYVPLRSAKQDCFVKNDKERAAKLAAIIIELFGTDLNFFTSESPMAKAIETGVLCLPESQGGDKPCKVTLETTHQTI